MLSRITYTDDKENKQYDILRLYYGGDGFEFSNVNNVTKKYKMQLDDWKPNFEYSYYINSSSAWPKDSYAIMFSGGFDSLSLVLRHLEKGERVYLLSIGFSEEQSNASLIVKLLKSIYGTAVIGPIKLFDQICVDGESTIGLTQQPFTAFYASHMPDTVREHSKALECAYIMNDDAISYQNELKAIYNNAMKCHVTGHHYPPIKFPLTKVSHFENIEYVSKIEKKYNIIFPALSAEFITCNKYLGNKNLYVVKSEDGGSKKPNKECDVYGYLILEKDISPRKRKELKLKMKREMRKNVK